MPFPKVFFQLLKWEFGLAETVQKDPTFAITNKCNDYRSNYSHTQTKLGIIFFGIKDSTTLTNHLRQSSKNGRSNFKMWIWVYCRIRRGDQLSFFFRRTGTPRIIGFAYPFYHIWFKDFFLKIRLSALPNFLVLYSLKCSSADRRKILVFTLELLTRSGGEEVLNETEIGTVFDY